MISDPAATVYLVIYPTLGDPRRKFSQMPSEAFRQTSTLRLPGTLRGNARVYGRDSTVEPIFTRPGKYVIRVGENLEGDFADKSAACTVTFVQKK